jgi:hypothetical protein
MAQPTWWCYGLGKTIAFLEENTGEKSGMKHDPLMVEFGIIQSLN